MKPWFTWSRTYQGKFCILLQEETTGLREKLKKKTNAQFKERKKQVFIHRWSSKSFKSVKYFKVDLNSNRKNSMAYVAVSYQKL